MKYIVSERSFCRICGSNRLTCFLELPNMPFTDEFLCEDELGSEFLWPVKVYVCEDCWVTQTLHDVNTESYYREHRYSPTLSPFADRFMQEIAERVWSHYHFQIGDVVIEIGSADGTQLVYFQRLGAKVFGFEPSEPLAQIASKRGIPVAQQLFNEQTSKEIPIEMLPAQVVMLTYTFDHLPDPLSFLNTVRQMLDSNRGILVIEVHDLEKIVKRREFCLFAHEHTVYYSLATIQRVLRQSGFELISYNLISEQQRRGNSLLVVATLRSSIFASRVLPSVPLESFGIITTYLNFGTEVNSTLLRLQQYVKNRRQHALRLAGYGAGGRGVITLASIAQSRDFAYVCDKNAEFHGLYTPGAHVLVDSPNRLLTDPVDEVIVFFFGYFKEITEELTEFRARGGKLVSLLELL